MSVKDRYSGGRDLPVDPLTAGTADVLDVAPIAIATSDLQSTGSPLQ